MRDLHSPMREVLTAGRAADLAAVLRVLADPARLTILSLLAFNGPSRPHHLTPLVGLSQPCVSHHLGKLAKAGLVQRVANGRTVLYSLKPEAMQYVGIQLTGGSR
jgi:ArsR family transcriptional regulator